VFRSPAPVLRATSIAIVGASERARWPTRIHSNLKEFGYTGAIYPINPRRDEVWGVPCYPGFGALPEPVDYAMVIVPAPAVQAVLEDGAAHGLKGATVYAANIGEGTDPEIVARGEALKALVEKSGMVVAGPNCMGAMSYRERLLGYPNTTICRYDPGPVAAVFQSGGTLQFWVGTAQERGVRFSYAISSGNELGLDLADYVNFLVDDPETRIIVLFIEGIRRMEVFKAACARALEAGKPILAVKTGRTEASRAAAKSHTGAIGGDWAGFEALCERYGIIVCPSLDDLTETALAFLPGRLPKGRRIGFVTTSGGTVDLLYDYSADEGAVMPPYAKETVERMQPFIPPEMTPKNPLDAGIPAGNDVLAGLCQAALDDPSVDMLAVAGQISSGRVDLEGAAPLKALLEYSTKPIVGFGRMRYRVTDEGVKFQDHVGYPFLQGLPETLRAMNGLAFYGARAGTEPTTPGAPKGKAADLEGAAFDALLERHGVSLPKSVLAADGAAAAQAAAEIGFPVVLKVVAPDFSHKTEVGGVLVGLSDASAVSAGVDTLTGRIREADPSAEITGYLVQEMVSGIEMIAGCRDDEVYGPVVVVGAGGVLVELVRDAATRLLPVGEEDVRDMIAGLRVKKLLDGFRGAAPADIDALVAAVVGLGKVYLDHRHILADLEVNPIIVRDAGQGVAAVDVRPIRREP
jgi:acetyltransferase